MPKISIIVASDKLDKLYPAAILASTAAAMGWEAELFFTLWGLQALKRDYEPSEVSSDYKAYEHRLGEAIASKALPGWREMLARGKANGRLRVYACSATLDLLNIRKEDLTDLVDGVVGAATFLGRAKDSDVDIFIS